MNTPFFTTLRSAATAWLLVGGLMSAAATADQQPTPSLKFSSDQEGNIRFDTGFVRGQLQTDQLAFGIHQVEDGMTGQPLAGRYGLFNIYRVFSNGKRYGQGGWSWKHQTTLHADGSVTICCPPEADRPFLLCANYSFSQKDTLDLEIEVTPQQDLHGFEVFLASYFDPAYDTAAAYVTQDGRSGFMPASRSLGHWLTFPRDAAAIEMFHDGRWTLPPNPVDWKMQPRLRYPLAVRRPSTTAPAVLLMAPRKDCFAVSMPFETETHYSVYLSLFGEDLIADKPAACRARLQFYRAPNDQQIIQAYQDYVQERAANHEP